MIDSSQILFGGTVTHVDDILGVGRVRVKPQNEKYLEIINSLDKNLLNTNKDDVKSEYFFKDEDPFCYIPFLPFHINVTPSVDDYVHIIYYNLSENLGRKRQFYIKGPLSSLSSLSSEDSNQTKGLLGILPNVKSGIPFKNESGYYKTASEGVVAKPEDYGIYSKGKSDIILKDTEIVIRAKKTPSLKSNENPVVNKDRSFLQISDFNTKTSNRTPFKNITEVPVEQPIVALLEYEIDYGLDTVNGPYTGNVNIYNIPARNKETLTTTFSRDTALENYNDFYPVFTHEFTSVDSLDTVIKIITDIIKGLNEGKITLNYSTIINGETNNVNITQLITAKRFPFYYRPSIKTQDLLNSGTSSQINTIRNLTTRIVYPLSNKENPGAGLISYKNKFGLALKTNIQTITSKLKENVSNSYAILGSDNVYLISRTSQIPGKSKIIVEDSDVYGISEERLSGNYLESTEGIVRGESLKKLLSLIVRFLLNHQHLYNRLSPYETTTETSPISKSDLQSEFNLFDQKVINQNIRINWYLSKKDNVNSSFIF